MCLETTPPPQRSRSWAEKLNQTVSTDAGAVTDIDLNIVGHLEDWSLWELSAGNRADWRSQAEPTLQSAEVADNLKKK